MFHQSSGGNQVLRHWHQEIILKTAVTVVIKPATLQETGVGDTPHGNGSKKEDKK